MKFVMAHKREVNLYVQVLNHKGLIDRLKIDAPNKKEWTYVDDVRDATLFEERLADHILHTFCASCKRWIHTRPLRGIEKDLIGLPEPVSLSEYEEAHQAQDQTQEQRQDSLDLAL